ncbi:MAG: LacI family DNA-binding transcriptional regulator [Butyricicoccus sp.]
MNIYDIAELAGVSIATVSRVVNDSPMVSEKTKQRVRKVMEENNYTPNVFARGLGLNSMKTVGLVCPDVSDAYMAKAVSYLEHNLKEYGYDCILYCSGHGYEDRQIAVNTILNKRIDALILIGSSYADDDADSEQVEYIREAAKQVPVFLMNGYVRGDNIYCALCNDYDVTFLTVSELIRSGRTRILFLSDSHSYSANQKLKGYEDALRAADLPVDDSLKLYIQNDINQVRDYLLFRTDLKMDAVFATEDGLAAGALKYAKKKGLSVPESISIIGYNNSELSVCCDPELSTIDSRGERLCRIIIDSMMLLKQDKKIKPKVYANGFLVRRSTTDF